MLQFGLNNDFIYSKFFTVKKYNLSFLNNPFASDIVEKPVQ